jgi:hypothetical protein
MKDFLLWSDYWLYEGLRYWHAHHKRLINL